MKSDKRQQSTVLTLIIGEYYVPWQEFVKHGWRAILSTTDEKWLFRNLGGRKWMKLSGEQGSKLF
ncbi:hypothetical protein VEE59_28960 [Escherichia coli]|nr:hypothetical protein VEE59_28960 [Escherichia coli]